MRLPDIFRAAECFPPAPPGRDSMLKRLEQLLSTQVVPTAPVRPPALPSDRPAGFAEAAASLLGPALLSCNEIYPREGAHTVLRVVVDREASRWQPELENLHARFFEKTDPLSPVELQVIDRAAENALQQLAAAGLISFTTRASRPLFPAPGTRPPALTPEQEEKLASLRQQFARKLKMAQALGGASLTEETRPPLLEAIRLRGCIHALELGSTEPENAAAALKPPLGPRFADSRELLAQYVADDGSAWEPVAAALS